MCRILQFNLVKLTCEFLGLFFEAVAKFLYCNDLPMERQQVIEDLGFGWANALREITKRGRK